MHALNKDKEAVLRLLTSAMNNVETNPAYEHYSRRQINVWHIVRLMRDLEINDIAKARNQLKKIDHCFLDEIHVYVWLYLLPKK
jgi:hypothetical protein